MTRISSISPSGSELTDAIDNCLAGIDRLSHEVKDASSYIPAYDQRSYANSIKGLSEKLQAVRASCGGGKKKFSFKTAKRNANATNSTEKETLNKTSPSQEKSDLDLLKQATQHDDTKSNATTNIGSMEEKVTGLIVTNRVEDHYVLESGPEPDATQSGTVTNIRQSFVNLSPPTVAWGHPFATLTLKDINNSLIVCGKVVGPIHITNVKDSVLVIASHQFRMHGSSNVDVYLHCSSRPIIEDCENIRFAPFPGAYVS